MLLFLGMIPIFAGLLACIPEYVPLGNPEKSRIDPAMAGVWHVSDPMEPLIGQFLYFQPWDKRTWMVTSVAFEIDPDALAAEPGAGPPAYDLSNYEELVEFLRDGEVDDDDIEFTLIVYKGWETKLRGQKFLMLEWRGLVNDAEDSDPYEPFYWLDFRVAGLSGAEMELRLIDPEFEPLSEAPRTRRDWEKVIRKHVDNPNLYSEEKTVLRRIDNDDKELIGDLIFYAFTRDFL